MIQIKESEFQYYTASLAGAACAKTQSFPFPANKIFSQRNASLERDDPKRKKKIQRFV